DRVPAIETKWNLYEIRELEAFIGYKTGMESIPHFENFSELSSSEASIKTPAVFKTRSIRIIAKKRLIYDGESSGGDAADQTKKFCIGPNNPPEFPNADLFNSSLIFTSPKTTAMQTREGIATSGTSGSMSVPKVYFTSGDIDEVDTSANFQAKFKNRFVSQIVDHRDQPKYNAEGGIKSGQQRKELGPFDGKIRSDHVYRQAAMLSCIFCSATWPRLHNFLHLYLNELILNVIKRNPNTCNKTLATGQDKIKIWVQHAGDKLTKAERRDLSPSVNKDA
ncbi:unnamed protein product, partial [Allacma fusca]